MNEMEAFWQRQHVNRDPLFLSGNGEQTLDILQIRDIFPDANTMLNVGIGLGVFEDYCLAQNKTIDCLDIATAARDRVVDKVRSVYLDPALLPDDQYDLVTELLVAQHLDDVQLSRHLVNCVRALRRDGIYAIQIPAWFFPKTKIDNMVVAQQAGSVCRSIQRVAQMVEEAHGQIIHLGWRGNFPQHNSIWYIYHIKKAQT